MKKNNVFLNNKSVAGSIIIATLVAVFFIFSAMQGQHDMQKKPPESYSWQAGHAKATSTGDLEWAPQSFKFKTGRSIRYIDYENGDDNNNGKSTSSAWKHHPWDANATGKAASCSGIKTYIFKRGSEYRGTLVVKESGKPGNPIRLTVDPSWGEGEAILSGSMKITGGWTKGTGNNKDIPEGVDVWHRDLDFAPRTLWMVENKEIIRIPLARMPNWKITDPEDIKSEWWSWDYKDNKPFNVYTEDKNGKELVLGIDTENLTGPEEFYADALVWSEFGWVDGTPYPSRVQAFDKERKGIGFEGYLGSARSRVIARHHRYYLEDKPHYLDDPEGEFWFDKKGDGGRMYVTLPGGADPNTVHLEAGKEKTLIHMEEKDHIYISGLSFRFTNVSWDLTELPWADKFALKKHVNPACIRVWGGGRDINVANCSFTHVNAAVFMKAVKPGLHLNKIAVTDCEIRETDHSAITIQEGILWGYVLPEDAGHLYDAKVLRNFIYKAGQRAQRVGSANAIDVSCGETVEIAGNIIDTPWHAGINVYGGKINGNVGDIPLSRILIYQNKVINGIRTGDDCGNIETWQGGAAYVYNNVSGNPGGFRNPSWMSGKDNPDRPGSARFGMAYYLDGAFKNYYFNNIGWGLSKDPWSKVGATTMFQEIISYQNTFFNNTAYNFVKGTRRQAPQAGSNKYLGNIWDGIGDWVFWLTIPAKSPAAGNEMDAGPQKDHYALETNAFSGNIFHDITGKYGAFKPSGQWHETYDDSRTALKETGAIAYDLGEVAAKPPLSDPANHDFSLTENSRAIDKGAKVFVPWSLYAMVGEWNFYPAGNDPGHILDEHWYMTPYYTNRGDYYTKPRFHLRGVNITKEDYMEGPLEDWTKGALNFNGIDQYAVCDDSTISRTLEYTVNFKWNRAGEKELRRAAGKDFKSPEVYDNNFLIEAYFKTAPGTKQGLIAGKMGNAGYSLEVNPKGGVTFIIKGGDKTRKVESKRIINDGQWHHIVAEADREARKITLYINGQKDRSGKGIGTGYSLENDAPLYVAGTPEGRNLKGTMEFLRISLGTFADAKTDIHELYAWQFNGPFLKDFTGKKAIGKRDAGALEKSTLTNSY